MRKLNINFLIIFFSSINHGSPFTDFNTPFIYYLPGKGYPE